jgi:y4mF family transcriptional regulator
VFNFALGSYMSQLSDFVKERRKRIHLTQVEFAERTGVALTVVRKIEQGKTNVSMAKVNTVLAMFGHVLGPVGTKAIQPNETEVP